MADNKAKCGEVPITYPKECSYVCYCTPESGCTWSVTCGDWTTGGKGLTTQGPSGPSVVLDGKLAVCAKILQKAWKRTVTVPAKLRRKTIRKRLYRGKPEQIAQALGLKLGARRKG
jgi:hypothetical protein